MSTIGEADLADFVKNEAVKRINIIRTDNGRFEITAELTWKEGLFKLVTSRKTPREWASLDRLVNHFKSSYGDSLPPITLTI